MRGNVIFFFSCFVSWYIIREKGKKLEDIQDTISSDLRKYVKVAVCCDGNETWWHCWRWGKSTTESWRMGPVTWDIHSVSVLATSCNSIIIVGRKIQKKKAFSWLIVSQGLHHSEQDGVLLRSNPDALGSGKVDQEARICLESFQLTIWLVAKILEATTLAPVPRPTCL